MHHQLRTVLHLLCTLSDKDIKKKKQDKIFYLKNMGESYGHTNAFFKEMDDHH
jgi:hypothetical protein